MVFLNINVNSCSIYWSREMQNMTDSEVHRSNQSLLQVMWFHTGGCRDVVSKEKIIS